MEYEIVRMEAAHVPQIAAPWNEAPSRTPGVRAAWLRAGQPLSLWLVAQAGGGPGLCGQPVGDGRGGYDESGRPAGRPPPGDCPGAGDGPDPGAGRRWRAQPDPGGPGLQWAGQGAVWEHGLCPGGLPPGYYLSPKEDGRFSERSGIYDTDGRGILLRRDRCGPWWRTDGGFSQTASPPRWICTGFTAAWCRKVRPVKHKHRGHLRPGGPGPGRAEKRKDGGALPSPMPGLIGRGAGGGVNFAEGLPPGSGCPDSSAPSGATSPPTTWPTRAGAPPSSAWWSPAGTPCWFMSGTIRTWRFWVPPWTTPPGECFDKVARVLGMPYPAGPLWTKSPGGAGGRYPCHGPEGKTLWTCPSPASKPPPST